METVGSRIKAARQKAGFSQEKLACELGTTKSTISKYEKDLRQPRIEQLLAIAKVLDIPVSALLSDAEKISAAIDIAMRATYPDLTGKTAAFQPFTKTDAQLIELGGFAAISEFYNLPEEAQKKALEDIRGFAEFVIDKYKKQAADDK